MSHEMRNELERAERRARLASEKRNGRGSVNNPACFPEEGGQGSSKDVSVRRETVVGQSTTQHASLRRVGRVRQKMYQKRKR